MTIRVTVWNEYRHEKSDAAVRLVYPDGLHAPIAAHLRQQGMQVRVATLDEPDNGLPAAVLAETDVLTWWGHMAHGEVSDAVVARVQQRVLEGMGLLVLHSGHFSKVFQTLMGTTCNLIWREADERERIWVVEPGHPIAAGLGPYFEIPREEMYGERFDVPAPETTNPASKPARKPPGLSSPSSSNSPPPSPPPRAGPSRPKHSPRRRAPPTKPNSPSKSSSISPPTNPAA